MTGFLHGAVHLLARLAVFFTHRAVRIAPEISVFVPRSDKRADVDLVRDAMRELTKRTSKAPAG
jgi:hypothetical protein